jgi:hypothetical protein
MLLTPGTTYVAVFALATGIGLGWSVADWRADARNLQRVQAAKEVADEQQRMVSRASASFETQREQRGARERIVVKEVERVLEKPVYSVACVDDVGLRILADDIAASNARRQLGPALPSASSPGR